MTPIDAQFMARALTLARNGLYTTDPNPRVGCLLVRNGAVLAEGWTQRAGLAHAEIDALSKTADATGATAYVTLEPCSHTGRTGPCCDALIAAGVARVVAAMADPNPLVAGRGLEKLRAAGVIVECGLLQEQAEMLNRGFFKRMRSGLPWVRSKLAMSLDGRTAMVSGESRWITSQQARQDVQRWRAESSAVLTGIGTVLADNPSLLARVDFDLEQPVRVIVDTDLRLPETAQLLRDGGQTWVMTCCDEQAKVERLRQSGADVTVVDRHFGRVDLRQVFKILAQRQLNNVWVEAGAILNGALLAAGLVDEWLIYMAPCVLGDQGRGLFHLPDVHNLADKKTLTLCETRQVGPDLRLTLRPV